MYHLPGSQGCCEDSKPMFANLRDERLSHCGREGKVELEYCFGLGLFCSIFLGPFCSLPLACPHQEVWVADYDLLDLNVAQRSVVFRAGTWFPHECWAVGNDVNRQLGCFQQNIRLVTKNTYQAVFNFSMPSSHLMLFKSISEYLKEANKRGEHQG